MSFVIFVMDAGRYRMTVSVAIPSMSLHVNILSGLNKNGQEHHEERTMLTDCPDCGLSYDDLYRRTYCPHPEFAMHTVVVKADGASRVCTSIEELEAFLQSKEHLHE